MHVTASLLATSAILVCGAFLLVALCARLRLPSLLGYILAGVLLGPSGLGLVHEPEALATIGEVGVILLLFTLGLEFSFERLRDLRRVIFSIGGAQVVVTVALVAAGAAAVLGLGWLAAVLTGGAVAMSSTALCLKILARENALGTAHGRLAFAVLLFQDMAAVALLLLHDSLAGHDGGARILHLLGGATGLAAAFWLARTPLQALARWIAALGDPELAQLLALGIALGSAILAMAVGFSPALAAFVAGMIISEGDARHVVEKEIRPFRDLLVGIFFVGIGTQIALTALPELWPEVMLWLLVLVPVKGVVVHVILRALGEPAETALRTGAILAHGGEFGLLLVSASLASGVLPAGVGDPLLLALAISMPGAALVGVRAARTQP